MTIQCAIKSIPAIIAGFIFIAATDFGIHGVLLSDAYEATENLWRPKETMDAYMPYMTAAQLILTLLFTFFYGLYAPKKNLVEGLKFGAYLGIIIGAGQASSYIWMPIPFTLAMSWFIAATVQLAGLGVISGLLLKTKEKEA